MIVASVRGQGVEYAIRDIMVEAEKVRRSGKKLVHLNIGDPVKYGFDTPAHIRHALTKAVDSGLNYYSASEGLKELREAVTEKENQINGAQIEPDNVIVTSGISEAIMFVMGAIINPGDEVLLPGPCYPPYLTYAKFFDGKAITYRTVEKKGWAPDLADLESKINSKTKLLVIINPSNPCGSVYSKEEISKILDLAATHEIPVAADEIYDRIVYDGNFTSVASLAKDLPLIGLNGFSKAYLMTGWRLGYVFVQDPESKLSEVWDAIQRMSRVRLCAATPVQIAGVEALRGPQEHVREMVSELKRRRDFSWKRVNEIPGLAAAKPAGAFYLFPRIQLNSKWKDDKEFVTDLLKETGVIVVNGSGFDPVYGKDHFRAVFLPPEAILGEAFSAIEEFMKRHT
ncbi:MAG: aminotransferase class I/II-fold pyridoxal phosphate-dependent enzyme [Candidatus Bathyarchaeia archaeon]|jgi:tyrosine/nicotianamine family aminotransferase